jgi:glycosyltransferase involved in cell wall biosynthesis
MPKVTIIIPVYNAEKYLRACLDSIVNQTLTDIQIICVDDGSPDCCPQILDEYTAKDNRITVIHQQNAGVSAARNAAYPYIKGEYTLFVDNDDEIAPDLCEKAVAVADAEQADMTYFFYDRIYHCCNQKHKILYHRDCKIPSLIGKHLLTENDYAILLDYGMIWLKLWRSQFLLDNDIRCPTGYSAEDGFMNWKALVHNPKVALLPEAMYHNRINLSSLSHDPSRKYQLGYPAMYDLLKETLQKLGHYHGQWKRLFLNEKLVRLRMAYMAYISLPPNRKKEYQGYIQMLKDQLGQDEQEYLSQKNRLKHHIKVFHFALLGSRFAAVENATIIALRRTVAIFRKLRNKWRHRYS